MAEILLNINLKDDNAIKQLNSLKSQIHSIATEFGKVDVNKDLTKQLNAFAKALNASAKASKEYYREKQNLDKQTEYSAKANEKTIKQTEAYIRQVNNLQKHYQNLIKAVKNTSQKYPSGIFDTLFGDVDSYAKEMDNLFKSVQNGNPLTEEQLALLKELKTKYTELAALLPKMENLNKKNVDGLRNHNQSILSMLPSIFKWQLAMTAVMLPLRKLQEGWQSLNDTLVRTEDTIIEIQRVLSSNVTGKEISDTIYDLAIEYGQTFDNVSEIALNFVKAGLGWKESIESTRAALLALNVAELDSEQASEGLIAIMTQFGKEAKDLTDIVDLLNKTADNNAVTTEELLIALQKTGSYAKQANLTLEDTVAIITRLSKATAASGSNLGNAIKSLLAYTTKTSSLNFYASLSDDMNNAVHAYKQGSGTILDVWQALSKEIQSNNISRDKLMNDSEAGGLDADLAESLEEVYGEIANIYDTAGTYRKNYFIALMNNLDDIQGLIGEISESSGYSAAENEKYLNTYTAKVTILQAKWEKLANDEQGLLGFKKALVEAASGLLTVLDYTGGLNTLFISLATVVTFVFGNKIIAGIKNFIAGLQAAKVEAGALGATLNTAFGVVGLIATVTSLTIGLVTKLQQEQQKLRDETIARWNSEKEEAQELTDLYYKYKSLSKSDNEYLETQNRLIEVLGEKKNLLSDLKVGTEEYETAIKNLTESELLRYRQDAEAAKKAAEENLINAGYKEISRELSPLDVNIVYKYGAKFSYSAEEYYNAYQGVIEDRDDSYSKYVDALREYERARVEYENKSNPTKADKKALDALKKTYKSFETSWEIYYEAAERLAPYIEQYENSLKYLDSLTSSVEKNTEDTSDTVEKIVKNLSGLGKTSIDNLIKAFEEMRDAEKDAYEWEEKKLAVLEAQKALKSVENDLSVRVLDENGNWTRATDQKAVEQARENLSKAQYDLEQTAYAKIISLLEKGTTNSEVLSILQEISTTFGNSEFANSIIDFIRKNSGVDISDDPTDDDDQTDDGEEPNRKPTFNDIYKPPTSVIIDISDKKPIPLRNPIDNKIHAAIKYDEGGIINGIGGIKATEQPETVLNPTLTRQILSPSTNSNFSSFARSLGMLFGTSNAIARTAGSYYNNSIGTNNTYNNGNSYNVNGMNITREVAETTTIAELFEMAAFSKSF